MSTVTSIEFVENAATYDISVEDNENFFCGSPNDFKLCLVHNCAKFTKEDRATTGNYPPDDPNVLDYTSMDVQVLLGIRREQLRRADHVMVREEVGSRPVCFRPYFEAHVTGQMSNTSHGISFMEEAGSPVDLEYLEYLKGKNSPLHKSVTEAVAQMRTMPSVQRVNDQLLKESGKKSGGLFGHVESSFIFNIKDRLHKERLFFDELGLEPIGLTSTGLRAMNKAFVSAYKETVPEISVYDSYTKITKLLSTYVKGWYNKVVEDIDSAVVKCLRPGFGFFTIVTGRLNSFRPSLQQIPARSAVAKYVKRAFRSPRGFMGIKYDYSSHEVRLWSVIAKEFALGESFKTGLNLRRRLIVSQDEKEKAEIREELKKKGDLHVLNCYLFFKKWIDKSDPLRDAVKALVFGVLYGKAVRTLAGNLQSQRISSIVAVLSGLTKELDSLKAGKKPADEARTLEVVKAAIKKANADLKEANDQDWLAFAQDVMDKLFDAFPKGKEFLDNSVQLAVKYGQLMSPIGRVRRLWRVFTGRKGVIAAASRRAQNSPIQGLASEVGCSAAYLIMMHAYDWLVDHLMDMELMPKYNRAVHDCNVFQVPYELVIPMIHIKSFMATTGVAEWFTKTYGMEWTVIPEIEMEFFATEDKSYKWNWEISSLLTHLRKVLTDQRELGDFESDAEMEEAWQTVLAPWKDAKMRKELCKHYPVLDVNIEPVVIKEVRAFEDSLAKASEAINKAKRAKNAATA